LLLVSFYKILKKDIADKNISVDKNKRFKWN